MSQQSRDSKYDAFKGLAPSVRQVHALFKWVSSLGLGFQGYEDKDIDLLVESQDKADAASLSFDNDKWGRPNRPLNQWGGNWVTGFGPYEEKIMTFSRTAARTRLLINQEIDQAAVRWILDYLDWWSNIGKNTRRDVALATIAHRSAAAGLQLVDHGEPAPRWERRRTTMVVQPVQPPVAQAASAPVPAPPPAPAPAPVQPASRGLSPLEVFQRIEELKAAGLTDDQIKVVLGLLK